MYNKNLYSDGTSEDSEGKDSSFESVNDELEQEQSGKNNIKYKSAKLLDHLKYKQQKYQELIKKQNKREKSMAKNLLGVHFITHFSTIFTKKIL